jgi:rod shape-determining protein MreC
MLKRTHYIALSLVALITMIILNLPDQTTARLKQGIGSLFVPLFGLKRSAQQVAGNAGDTLVTRSELLRQNENLRHENDQLRLRARQAEALAGENDRLRQLVGWPKQRPWNVKLARVVLRDPANWWRTVQIDLGSRDGLSNNLPVLTAEGSLIGRVSAVSLTHSRIVLLGDPNFKVAAQVDNPTHDTGVIGASGPLDSGFVEMNCYLPRLANLKPGQTVWTRGDAGIFPPKIVIGQIVDSQPAEYGLYTVARVRLTANLNALEEVWVIFP